MRSRRKNRARIKLTPYGWVLVFLLVWTPLAGLGTTNNFLLIIFLLLLGLVGVSHTMAVRNLSGVDLARRFPEEIFAGRPFSVQYLFKSDDTQRGAHALTFRENDPLEDVDGTVTVPHVHPGETLTASGLCSVAQRGDALIRAGTISSTFPFGLARYAVTCGPQESILVFPRIQPVDGVLSPELRGLGGGPEHPNPFGTVPYHFRDYAPGDPYKHIEWKKSAQTGTLTTKVLSDESARDVVIRLPPDPSEETISRAASLVVFFGQSGTRVSLKGPGFIVEGDAGRESVRRLLTVLARWERGPDSRSVPDHSEDVVVEIDEAGRVGQ